MKFDPKAKEQGFYDVQEKDEWTPCIKCGGELGLHILKCVSQNKQDTLKR